MLRAVQLAVVCVAVLIATAGQVQAEIVTSGIFVGDLYEGFESNQANGFGFQVISGFDGHSTISDLPPSTGTLATTTGWSGGQLNDTILAKEGSYLGSIVFSQGSLEFSFDTG